VSTVDPLGSITTYRYDPLDRVTSITDSLGAVTSLSYDLDGNLLSVTDARNGLTQFGYDNMDRAISSTDALGQTETFSYDLDDNLTGHTDRKSQSQVLSYDALNRLTQVIYKKAGGATEGTVSYNYDAGNRVTSVNDSVGGILNESYDGLDRLTGESSPDGSVSYQYDTASRRTQMTVAGQTAVNYSYDNADRLTGITQGSGSVAIAYDTASRRTTLTLPNGIKLSYGYDNANELTGLTYKLGSTTIGSLTYGYNNDGEIVSRGGTFDVTNLPAAVASAVYDADNRLTNWGTTSLSYDANGNLTADGTNTYTWDTRNQLMSLSGGSTASFDYDALGRRESKTINGTATNFLYDGLNMEQELNGTTPTVNYLTGAGIDETLSRTDSSGTQSYLTDNLGSTMALTNSAGALSTSYSYEPYGNTTATGTTSTNALQYTGRENDGTGLYYYRARYYSPAYGRFISADPIGLLGGINEYAYADGNPVNLSDPLGLYPTMQFPLPLGAPTDFAGAQAMAEEQDAQAQYQIAQYNAMKIQYQAAQCLSRLFIANYHQYQGPLQSEFGPLEILGSWTHFVKESSQELFVLWFEKYSVGSAAEADALGSTAVAGAWLTGRSLVKGVSLAPLAYGTVLDIGSLIDATYFTITSSSSCCSVH